MAKYVLRQHPDKIEMEVIRFSNNIPNETTQNVKAMAWYLFKHTKQETTFGIIDVGLCHFNLPKLINGAGVILLRSIEMGKI